MIDTIAVLVRFMLYAAALVSAGTALAAVSLREPLGNVADAAPSIIVRAAVLVILASMANIAALIARLGGGFDLALIEAIAATPTGAAAALQIFGAVVLSFAVWQTNQVTSAAAVDALVVLISFGVSGHAAAAGLMPGLVAFVHIALVAWWLGALLLLHRACKTLAAPNLAQCVLRFSRQALALVGALILAGLILILAILGSDLLLWTPYVQTLTVKLLLVSAVLAVAAYNKFRLTPRLSADDPGATRTLRRSIALETTLFAGVLAATAWLTTFHSPSE